MLKTLSFKNLVYSIPFQPKTNKGGTITGCHTEGQISLYRETFTEGNSFFYQVTLVI